jgi:glycosyltransferase involved in cell wall biosynthesis
LVPARGTLLDPVGFEHLANMHKSIRSLTFICQTLGIGGAETVNRDLLQAAQTEGKVAVTAYVTFEPFRKMLQQAAIPTSSLPIIIDIIGDWKGLLKALVLWPLAVGQYLGVVWRARHSDVIVMSGFVEKIIVTPIAKLLNIPIVWIEFAPLTTVFHKFAGFPRLLYQVVSRLPAKIIVPTAHTERFFTEELHYSPKKLAVIPCARYRLAPERYSQEKYPHPTLVCVSRMEPGKGQDLLVQAFAQVSKVIPTAQLVFVGEGGFVETVKAEAERLKVTKQIQYLGRVEDPLIIMAKADVCIFPSVWVLEGFGMVTIEAMALGKPIVAFNCGPTPEIITDGETGLLAEAGDIRDLATKIVQLLQQPKLAQQLGKRAQRVFDQQYQFERRIHQYLAVFAEAADHKAAE